MLKRLGLAAIFVLLAFALLGVQTPGGPGQSNYASGSGMVSANSGSAGAVANYTAAGGSTTVGADQTLIDNGTSWTFTEPIITPAGTTANPSIQFGTDAGFYRSTSTTAQDGAWS